MLVLEGGSVPYSHFQLFEFSHQIMISIEQNVLNTISFFSYSLLVCLIQIPKFLLFCLKIVIRLHVVYVNLY